MAQVKTESEPEDCTSTSHAQQKRESLSPIEDEIEKIIEKFQISPSTKNKPLPGSRKKIERSIKGLVSSSSKKVKFKTSTKSYIRAAKLRLPKQYENKTGESSKWSAKFSQLKLGNSDHENASESNDLTITENLQGCSLKSDSDLAAETLSREMSSCRLQHRSSFIVDSRQIEGMDDTSPDELASYFEQMLFIPKPMSTMAEMMYA